jgi:hypothetical protein
MKDEKPAKPPNSHPHAIHRPGDSVLLSCVPLVLLLCSSCSSLVLRWGLGWRQIGSTEPVREFDSGGLVGIQRGSRLFMNLLPLAVRPAGGGRVAREGRLFYWKSRPTALLSGG